MKSTILALGTLCFALTSQAQTAGLASITASNQAPPNLTAITIIGERGSDHRIVQVVTQITNSAGRVLLTTNNAYVELATGMHHLVAGQWVPSTETVQVLPAGGAAATNASHNAFFPGDIYAGTVKLLTPDAKLIQFRPLGLFLWDGTNSVMLAELTNSIGQMFGNQIWYTNALSDGISGTFRYTFTRAGLEQDLILESQVPTPDRYSSSGLNPATTRLQLLTEFFSPPTPVQSTATFSAPDGPATDCSLNFGAMTIGMGKAFFTGTNAQLASQVDLVRKEWVQISGRQFLIEELSFGTIAGQLQGLPQSSPGAALTSPQRFVTKTRTLPTSRPAVLASASTMRLASSQILPSGFVLDFQTVSSTSLPFTFAGDTTYYLSGPVYLSGACTMEGGTVLKYDRNASINISWPGTLKCTATQYRPAIMTAKDDNTVGDTIAPGSPTGYYANPAILC